MQKRHTVLLRAEGLREAEHLAASCQQMPPGQSESCFYGDSDSNIQKLLENHGKMVVSWEFKDVSLFHVFFDWEPTINILCMCVRPSNIFDDRRGWSYPTNVMDVHNPWTGNPHCNGFSKRFFMLMCESPVNGLSHFAFPRTWQKPGFMSKVLLKKTSSNAGCSSDM